MERKNRSRDFTQWRVIERQPTGGNDAMDMGMESELLIPGMQHGEEADFRAEVLWIASDFEECLCTGAEQQSRR